MVGFDRDALGAGVLIAALVLATAGCAPDPADRLIHLPPPPDWERQLLLSREFKDDYFRGADTPLLPEDIAGFQGLEYWSPDPGYYFVGRIDFYEQPERLEIATTAGSVRPCEKVGRLRFNVDGEEQELQVYRLLDGAGDGFFLPFRDTTSGRETYPAGRYVELDGPESGPWVLDFNRAYNPSCAYGDPERFACPVTPPENRLQASIEAGERGYRHETGG